MVRKYCNSFIVDSPVIVRLNPEWLVVNRREIVISTMTISISIKKDFSNEFETYSKLVTSAFI